MSFQLYKNFKITENDKLATHYLKLWYIKEVAWSNFYCTVFPHAQLHSNLCWQYVLNHVWSFYIKMILHSIISQMKEMSIYPLVQRPKVLPGVSQKEHNVPRVGFCFRIIGWADGCENSWSQIVSSWLLTQEWVNFFKFSSNLCS